MSTIHDYEIVAMVTAVGAVGYGAAARQTVLSLLEHTAFPVVVGCDEVTEALVPRSPRVRIERVRAASGARAEPFLAKFATWQAALAHPGAKVFVHLDADAVLARPLTAAEVATALGGSSLAMVEQTTITGSTMGRPEFLRHFVEHSMAYLAPVHPVPELHEFRFHNSGVILFGALELRNFLHWAAATRAASDGSHHVGAHMIADQDYLQVWANVLRRGRCAELGSEWNHCAWWDADFPRPDARVVHFSNFCNGPPFATARRMESTRGVATPVEERVSFLVVTHDSANTIRDGLDVLATFDGAEVVVVDNASKDGTVDLLEGARVIRNATNVGFASAVAQAVEVATGSVLCLVNPDCFPTGEFLNAALVTLGRAPRTVVVPAYVHADGNVVAGRQLGYTRRKLFGDICETNGIRLRGVLADGRRHDTTWHWPLAACLVVRADVFADLGGMDPGYFCYMEDVDFGQKCHRVGVDIVEVDVPVVHLGAAGSAVTADRRLALLDGARLAYARNHYGMAFALQLAALRRVLQVARAVLRSVRSVRS